LREGKYFIRVYSSDTVDVGDGVVESSAVQLNPNYQLNILLLV